VLSTVAITVLFDPVRHRVQHFVDRRFYRRKYQTERTFNAFAERLPNMVQLQDLTDGLLDVVEQTLQPSQLIFWLRDETKTISVWLGGDTKTALNGPNNTLKTGQDKNEVDLNDPLFALLESHKGVQNLMRLDFDSPVLANFKAHQMQYALPFISQSELIGILTFSPPEAEDYSRDEINLLNNLATQVAPAIRVAQLVHQQQIQSRRRFRIEQELKVAHQTQQTLLPKAAPDLANWHIETYYQSAREVGGDFYDFIALDNNRWGVVIADVTDKGVPAAMVMAATRSLISAIAPRCQHPHQVLEEVNRQLRPIIPQRMFVTCFYAILTPATGQLEFANAGHDPPHWRRQSGIEEIGLPGFPLGLVDEAQYPSQEIALSPQESLLFYSDGLVEAHNPAREMFGFERVEQILYHGPNGTGSLIHSLLKALNRFTGPDWEQEDDVTLVTLTRTDLPRNEF
jgi:serine phosphatase RsbU (regulator of sigma subunit)